MGWKLTHYASPRAQPFRLHRQNRAGRDRRDQVRAARAQLVLDRDARQRKTSSWGYSAVRRLMDQRDADVGGIAPRPEEDVRRGVLRRKRKSAGSLLARRGSVPPGAPSSTWTLAMGEGASGTGPGSLRRRPSSTWARYAVFPGLANTTRGCQRRHELRCRPDRMRHPCASTLVILLKAGVRVLVFPLVGHEAVRVEEPEHLLAKGADRRVPRTKGDAERDEIAPTSPVQHGQCHERRRSPPVHSGRGSRSYRGSSESRGLATNPVLPVAAPRVHAVLLRSSGEPGREDTHAAGNSRRS